MVKSTSAIALPPPSNQSAASLVFAVCLILLAIIVIFMAIKLPRLLALFGTSSEWINGITLYHTTIYPSRRVAQSTRRHAQYLSTEKEARTFNDSMDTIIHKHSYSSKHSLSSKTRVRNSRTRYPPHVRSCIKALRPLLKLFRARVSPGFSFGQLLILVAYLALLSYASLYQSNIFLDYSRTGWVAVSQYPFVYAFAQKNNVIGSFLGFGYEKLNFFHRFAGKLVILGANIHALHFLYLWSFQGTLWDKMQIPNGQPIWGIVLLFCIDSLYFFSTPYIRNQAYNFFFRTHVIAVCCLLPATYMHKSTTLPYILACGAIYIFDWLLRLMKTRFARAYVRPLPGLEVTRVEIPHINAGWRAGQHVRLRVLSFQMGMFGWAETHPFTIASVSRSGPDGMVLLCKRSGDWTRKLFDMAQVANKLGAQINVVVEGPYGGPGHTIFSSFSAVVLVAGGSGITYCLAILEDLVLKDLNSESRVKSITLLWSIPDPAGIVHLLPQLSALVRLSTYTPVRICIFYTGLPSGNQPSMITQALISNMSFPKPPMPSSGRQLPTPAAHSGLPTGVTLTPGRPNFRKTFDEAIRDAVSLGFGAKDDERVTGMVVGVCGPVKMADDVSKAVSSIDPARRDQVGGVEICEEVFGW